ncbi:hypothetical protein AVEN_111675-1 [Araneus ventricosus]|uniref:Uncharacterized protein n=1 Tax=Araneus ventricosus TaxID=182803 RepID=A0A4Y2LP07_ARAVE|nr:hypothetical protein AVEN_111675-1 [Araneus ventricosus]
MARVEPFGKVAERFASQQETRFSVRFLVRFPQAFITSLFQAFLKFVSSFPQACFVAFQKVVKSPPSAGKIGPHSPLRSRIPTERNPPFFIPFSKPYSYKLQIPPSRRSNPRSESWKANAITTIPNGTTHDGTGGS